MIFSILMAVCIILIIVCAIALIKLLMFIPKIWDCVEYCTEYTEEDLKEVENV